MPTTETLPAIAALSSTELEQLCRDAGERAFRAQQIQSWVFQKRAGSFAEMRDLPAAFRQQLEAGSRLFA
ncbi:MAG: hypothetical protein ACE5KM_10645 [Planctomycetaceae bacterium]